jgi:hypothetical protein
MTTIAVYHNKLNPISGQHERYLEVAHVDIPEGILDINNQLEYAYRWTQNLMDSWSIKDDEFADNNDNVRVIAPLEDGYGHRSSSMGDLFRIVGTGFVWECACIGFDIADNKFADL